MARDDYSSGGHGKKKSGSRASRICRAIYNKDKGEFFGRNCSSWAKIVLFYMIYYSCLAGFFTAMMFGFFQTLSDTHPTQMGMYSCIKGNPGMGFRPQPNYESALISFNSLVPTTYMDKVDDILKFLKDNGYINEKNEPTDVTKDAEGNDLFGLDSLGGDGCKIDPLNLNSSFGYADGQPCILLKVNKIYGWKPVPFDADYNTTEHGLEAQKALGNRLSFTDIGVSCEGENDADYDSLGKIEYFPANGFSVKYFPYLNSLSYRAPLVFVKFSEVKPGNLIQVWCKVWAKNIYHHKNDKAGSARFELQVDNKI